MRAHSSPLSCNRVPFANERELQRFVGRNAQVLLGIEVVASTLPKGRPLHGIDILGVTEGGRVYIIECKHDVIGDGAIAQLREYNDALLADWPTLEARVAEHRGPGFHLAKEAPVLVAIGYRSEAGAEGPPVQKLIFKYPGMSFPRFVDSQSAGSVYLAVVDDSDHRPEPHPEVLKTHYAERHMESLPSEVRQKFWAIDGLIRQVGIRPKYSGKKAKDFASYRRGRRVCITARIGPNSITWCAIGRNSADRLSVEMGAETDANETFETLQDTARLTSEWSRRAGTTGVICALRRAAHSET
jgi:hypothetical protein